MESKYSESKHEIYDGECSVKYSDTPSSPKFNMHVHDAFEITLILSDDVELFINNVSYPVPKGSLLLFNTMDAHWIKYKGNTSYRRFVLWFKQDFLSDLDNLSYKLLRCFFLRNFEKSNMLRLSEEQLNEAVEHYKRFKKLKFSKCFMQNERLKLALADFLIFINDLYFTKNRDNIPTHHNDSLYDYENKYELTHSYNLDIL